jgi:hypothetical protein
MTMTRWESLQGGVKYVLLFSLVVASAANSLSLAAADWICPERGEATESNLEGNGSELVMAVPHLPRRGGRQGSTSSHSRVKPSKCFVDLSCRQLAAAQPRPATLAFSPLRC